MADTDPVLVTDELLDAGSVRLTITGTRADVVLARPDARNAQTPATWRALAAIPKHLASDIRVVVLSAEGPSFSAGLDLGMIDGTGVHGEPSLIDMASMSGDEVSRLLASYQDGFTWWRESKAVTVAAVQGHAVGAGFQLALACDLVVCADDARFVMRETSLGLVPDLGGTGILVETVGYNRALEICATGRWVYADEAVRLGIAQVLAPRDELGQTVDDLVAALLGSPVGALAATKRLLVGARDRTRSEQLRAERAEQMGRLSALAPSLGSSPE